MENSRSKDIGVQSSVADNTLHFIRLSQFFTKVLEKSDKLLREQWCLRQISPCHVFRHYDLDKARMEPTETSMILKIALGTDFMNEEQGAEHDDSTDKHELAAKFLEKADRRGESLILKNKTQLKNVGVQKNKIMIETRAKRKLS